MNKPLTDLAIKNRKSPDKREELPDGKISGLYFVAQPTGARSWAVRYRVGGKSRKYTIGAYPAIDLATARKRAQEALGEVARGNDPAAQKQATKAAARAEKRPANDLVEKIAADFIERHAKPNTRDWKETERLLETNVVSAWPGRRLSEIGRAEVHDLLDGIIDRGAPVAANRTFAQLRKLCNWAVSRGIIDRSPCDGLRAPAVEKARDRVLDERELGLVWRAAEGLGFPFGRIIQLLILTGQRKGEVGGMRWSEIDLEKAIWTIPGERVKNHREHQVPLSPQAIEILVSLPQFAGSDFVFSAGRSAPSGFSRAKTRLDGAIAKVSGGASAPWTLHDIRRSVASGMAGIGVSLPVIERCLNHVSGSFGGIAGIYQRYSFGDEKRAALAAWARFVETLVSGAPAGNVVDLATARG